MATESLCLVTPRDQDLFQALDRCPLTVRQILKLSEAFAYPFTTERRVQERLQCLAAAGRVRRWPYATAGRGALSYYTLTPLGYRLLHGHDAVPSGRGLFASIGVARQAHAQALAETIVHLFVGAHRSGISIENFRRENSLRLSVGQESLYPDTAFEIHSDREFQFKFYVELDNRTETVWPGSTPDSWGRKVQFYERFQDAEDERFRVLAITTGGPARLENMLRCAAELARNPRRSLVYGIGLRELLQTGEPLTGPYFRNHHDKPVSLLTSPSLPIALPLTAPPTMVGCPSCLRPLHAV
jgi:hypothetical protein